MPDIGIRPVFPSQFQQLLAPLVELLIDTVDGGHSMGFLPPLTRAKARSYWLSIRSELQAGTRLLLVACLDNRIIGTGQLVLSPWSNSQHRAELQRVFVASSCRGQASADC
jgi:hypothetical protein